MSALWLFDLYGKYIVSVALSVSLIKATFHLLQKLCWGTWPAEVIGIVLFHPEGSMDLPWAGPLALNSPHYRGERDGRVRGSLSRFHIP